MSTLAKKTILVTGAAGFIGSALVARLQKEKCSQLVLLSRRPPGEKALGNTHITASLEQLDKNTWRRAGIRHIDVVFHLGGFIPKTAADGNRVEEAYRDNLLGTRSLLESLPANPERIIFSSTVDVYDPIGTTSAFDENSSIKPSTLYAASKLFCEQLIRSHAQANGYCHNILRYGHIFGPGEDKHKKLIPETIKKLLRGERLTISGNGNQERDFLYIDDAVEATFRTLTLPASQASLINIVRGVSSPIRTVVSTLERILDSKAGILVAKNSPVERSLRFDNQRMRDALGAWRQVTLEEGLRREVEYFKEIAAPTQ